MKIAHIMPEWPHHGHLWFWREICCLREWGVDVSIFSTRRPSAKDRARHAFADAGEAETFYLWPMTFGRTFWAILSCFLLAPIGLFRCIGLAFTLEVDARPRWKYILPLLVPACIFARELRRRGIQHVHCHTVSKSAIVCMMVRRLTGIPFSLIVNANIEWWGGAMRQKFSDAVFTLLCTKVMVQEMKRDFPTIPPDCYALGRVGVDARRWTPPQGGRPARPDGELHILSVSRLVKSKGQDVLLRAVSLLKQAGLPVRLRIGGDGPEMDALQTLARELQLGDFATFLGSLAEDRYLAEMQAADVFVLASHAEPMGVVYMEAMSTEIPTIGTNAGGVPEMITDGVNGVLVPPNDPQSLACALRRLHQQPQLRASLGQAARQTILSEFDSRLWAADLYQRLTGHAPPTAPTLKSESSPAEAQTAVGGLDQRAAQVHLVARVA